MNDEKDYTFSLSPNSKSRHVAGPFDTKTHKPDYEIKISVPNHVKSQVEVNQILLGTPENCQWAWDIHNKSSWEAFIFIKKDGILVKI